MSRAGNSAAYLSILLAIIDGTVLALALQNPPAFQMEENKVVSTTVLENLYFESHLLESETGKDLKLLELLRPRQGNAVVYCASSNAVEYVHQYLRDHGLDCLRFHKRMKSSSRRANLEKFIAGRFGILVAAGPLESEAAKANIRMVVHFNYPASMKEYLHEIASAGADGLPSRCALLYLRKDKRTQKRDPEELRQVTVYAQSAMCRSKWLARYTEGPTRIADSCNHCDNCLRAPKSRPVEERKRPDLDAILEAVL